MPPRIDYKPIRNEITELYERGHTTPQIVHIFKDRGVTLNQRTLKQRFQEWQLSKNHQRLDYTNKTLQCRVAVLFYQYAFRDSDIIYTLE